MDADKVILLVEDNKDDELLTLRALTKNNIANKVVVARTGEEAVDLLFGTGGDAGRASAVAPTVILLDLNLPKMSGLDVLRKIRGAEKTRLLPVVVLTSSKEDEDILKSYAQGANAYVRKPVDFGQFVEAVKTLGLFWLLLNEVPKQRA
jgi:two-component system, response regulator